jgi:hypothetical protein
MLHGRPRNLVVCYQRRNSTVIHVYAGADRWCDAVLLKAACAAEHDTRAVWIEINQSTADARTAANLDTRKGTDTNG